MKTRYKVLIIFFIGVLVLNYLYLFNVDTEYAIRFGEIISDGDIEDFDKFFDEDTKIVCGDEVILYSQARDNIIAYIDSGQRIQMNSYGFGYLNEKGLAIMDTAHINGGVDGAITFTYIKLLFDIKVLKLELEIREDNTRFIVGDIYKIFFGKEYNF